MFHNNPITGRHCSSDDSYSSYVVDADHEFVVTTKGVKNPVDMKLWETSEAFFEYLGFILAMNDAVRGRTNVKGDVEFSETVNKTLAMLDKLDVMIDETPPIQQAQRFGNHAFRTWYQHLKELSFEILQDMLSIKFHRAIPEIMSYLTESFGNPTRIDYGTGHELSFVMFLCCLFKIGAFVEKDKHAVPGKIFVRYLEIVRKLQQTYRMEPAGSHGVWSLDDYQFVPFIWGSSQLIGHRQIDPTKILETNVVEANAQDYLFLGCIQYINQVKTGPFAEHSNQLWGISGVANWSKINGGLIKMYKVEVLGKFPVVQHILFGSLFPLKPAAANSSVRNIRMSLTPPPGTTGRTFREHTGADEEVNPGVSRGIKGAEALMTLAPAHPEAPAQPFGNDD